MMAMAMKGQREKIHPYKYLMWITIIGIVMMFAGLTSAYIVKSNQANWLAFNVPQIFWYSTGVIILSSITIMLSRSAFHNRNRAAYKMCLGLTILLGIIFVGMQYFGFTELWSNGITLTRNVSFSFLYVIVGLHALHVGAGVIALLFIFINAFRTQKKVYSSVSIDLMNTYWHFVDILWIYLLIFLTMAG